MLEDSKAPNKTKGNRYRIKNSWANIIYFPTFAKSHACDFQLQKCSEDIAATFQHNRRSPQMFWWFSRHHLAKVSWDLAKIKLLYLRLYISWWDNLLGCFFLEFLLCMWNCPVALWRLKFSIYRHMTNLWVRVGRYNKAFLPSLWGVRK